MNTAKEMMKPAELAPLLGVSVGRVYQLISSRSIPAIRVGGALRIPRAAWEAWLERRSAEALETLGRVEQPGTAACGTKEADWDLSEL